jgi:hypothetical protein
MIVKFIKNLEAHGLHYAPSLYQTEDVRTYRMLNSSKIEK